MATIIINDVDVSVGELIQLETSSREEEAKTILDVRIEFTDDEIESIRGKNIEFNFGGESLNFNQAQVTNNVYSKELELAGFSKTKIEDYSWYLASGSLRQDDTVRALCLSLPEEEPEEDPLEENETKEFLDEIKKSQDKEEKKERSTVIKALKRAKKEKKLDFHKIRESGNTDISVSFDGSMQGDANQGASGTSVSVIRRFKSLGYKVKNYKETGHETESQTTYRFTPEKNKSFTKLRSKASIEALYAFNRIASILLTEPYLYTKNAKEAKEELRRLREDVFKINILPCFYQTLELGLSGTNHTEGSSDSFTYLKGGAKRKSTTVQLAQKKSEEEITIDKVVSDTFLSAIVGATPAAIAGIIAGTMAWPVILTGAIIGGFAGWFFSSELSDNAEINLKRIRAGIRDLSSHLFKERLFYSKHEILQAKKLLTQGVSEAERRTFENKMKATLVQALDDIGENSTYPNTINVLSGIYYASFPCFTHFKSLVYKINANSKLNNLLKPDALEKKAKPEEKNPLNFYSKEFIGDEVYDYLDFLISFPMVDYDYQTFFESEKKSQGFTSSFVMDEYEADEIFSLKDRRVILKEDETKQKDNVYLMYSEGANDFSKKKNLFWIQCKEHSNTKVGDVGKAFYNSYFVKNREKIRSRQEKKIEFLLALKEALIEEVVSSNAEAFYDNPTYRKYVEAFGAGSVFKIMEESTYPDIDLPEMPASLKTVKKVSPAFYYYNPNKANIDLEDSVSRKLIKKSKDFKDAIKEKIVANEPIKEGTIKAELGIRGSSVITQVVSGGKSYRIPTSRMESSLSTINTSPSESKATAKASLEQVSLPSLSLNLNSFQTKEEFNNYTTNMTAKIKSLKTEINNIRSMFGRKDFKNLVGNQDSLKIKSRDAKETIEQFARSVGLAKDLEYSTEEGLLSLAKESIEYGNLDRGMKKAFPTFRLYLVEEDSIFSHKLTAYDDFYSYASVISFRVHSSRELAASTATIQIQNVSGILDGSKKEVIRDIDVDDRSIRSSDDDKFERIIESIVLRNGINAQLRAGYENSTNDLEILISGLITEVNYSNDGMIANVTLQSYGAELEKKIKGNLARDNKNNLFYSTHQLLGNLMLSPELKHFGKVKVGKIFQTGENASPALDINNYSNRSSFTWNYTTSWLDTLSEYQNHILIGSMFLGPVLRYGGALLAKTGVTRSMVGAIARGSALTANWTSKTFSSRLFWGVRSGLSTAGGFLSRFSNVGQGLRIGSERIRLNFSDVVSQNLTHLNSALNKIKNGLVDDIAGLSVAEQAALRSVRSRLTLGVTQQLDDLGLAALERAEVEILTVAIAEQGLAFGGLKNFGFSALGNAISATSRAGYASVSAANAALPVFQKGISLTTGGKNVLTNSLSGGSALLKGLVRSSVTTAGVSAGLLFAGINATIILDVLSNAFSGTGNFFNEKLRNLFSAEKDDTLKLMLSPQDDNLFCPAVESYLVYDNGGMWTNSYPMLKFKEWGSGITNTTLLHIPDMLGWTNSESALGTRFEEFKQLYDTRLVINKQENEYVLKSQTIFDTFHEMSLRHPGYVYGARPYGDTIEYRMFFGLPNQRYWAEDLSTVDALRLNKIIRDLNEDPDELLSDDNCKILYEKEYSQLSRIVNEFTVGRKYSDKKARESGEEKIKKDSKRAIITSLALKEYLVKTKKRFRPFRKMHLLNAYENIVANNIVVSAHDVINTVTVHYSNKYGDEKPDNTQESHESIYSMNLMANTAIPDNSQLQKAVTSENIIGPSGAYRYGIGELLYGAKKMYTGSILTLGDPKIHPWDVVILDDDINRMYGPLEVKSVTHMFSHQSGFLTDVEVNALVTYGEDALTYPMIEQAIVGKAREQLYQKYSNRASFERATEANKEFYFNLVDEIIEDTFDGMNSSEVFKKEAKEHFAKEFEDTLKKAENSGTPVFLNDVVNEKMIIPESIRSKVRTVAGTGLTLGATAGGLEWLLTKRLQGRFAGMLLSKHPVGVGFGAFMATSLGLSVGSDRALDMIQSSLRSGHLGKNLFRPVMFSKISNQSLIEVYPLVKDGRPLLAGGFEGVPAQQTYKNVLGNIFSQVSDVLEEYGKIEQRLNHEGPLAVVDIVNGEYDFSELKQPAIVPTIAGKAVGILGFEGLERELVHFGRR